MKAIFYLCVALKIKSILFPLLYFLFFWGIEVTIQMPNYKFVCNQYNLEQNAKLSFRFTILGKRERTQKPFQSRATTSQNGRHFLLNTPYLLYNKVMAVKLRCQPSEWLH